MVGHQLKEPCRKPLAQGRRASLDTPRRLAEADACAKLGPARRHTFWSARAVRSPSLLSQFEADSEDGAELTFTQPQMTLVHRERDRDEQEVSHAPHPLSLCRIAAQTWHAQTPGPDAPDPVFTSTILTVWPSGT